MRLILPMGGRGTRLRPLSHTTPKALLPVAGRPAVAYALDAFARALARPVDEVVFVLAPADESTDVPDRLARACQEAGATAAFAVQPRPLGTAHAIACAGDRLAGEVLTVWSDTLFEPAGVVDLAARPDLVAWTYDVPDPRRFGVVARAADGTVAGLVEKPADARFTETLIGAYYVRDGAALRATIEQMMARRQRGAGGEYQLTDALDARVQAGARLATSPVAAWLDVGTLPAYLDAVARVLDRQPTPLRDGVTLHPPVYLAPDAVVEASTLGPYVAVEAGAVVRGSTVRHAVVFAGATVADSALDGAVVGHRATAAGARGSVVLGDDASCGLPLRARSPLDES